MHRLRRGEYAFIPVCPDANREGKALQWFETATTRLYWAFVIPLAGAFDGGQKLFGKVSETRRAVREKIREKGRQEGRKQGHQQGQRELAALLRRHATRDPATGRIMIDITPEVEALLGNADDSD